jgi:hypothetical protein
MVCWITVCLLQKEEEVEEVVVLHSKILDGLFWILIKKRWR